MTGSSTTRLVVLRGNSGSGKSSVAAGIRAHHGGGVALVGQDYLRRTLLDEPDRAGAANIGLIDTVARYALDAGLHVVVEGILNARRYGPMLSRLCTDHRGLTRCYYLDIPFEETLRRHATRPEVFDFGEPEMRSWYRRLDLLPEADEAIVPAESSLHQTVARILRDTGLDVRPTTDPAPMA